MSDSWMNHSTESVLLNELVKRVVIQYESFTQSEHTSTGKGVAYINLSVALFTYLFTKIWIKNVNVYNFQNKHNLYKNYPHTIINQA